ncbi:hypothetical protein ACS0TY_000916 [Phlomoides rotata]
MVDRVDEPMFPGLMYDALDDQIPIGAEDEFRRWMDVSCDSDTRVLSVENIPPSNARWFESIWNPTGWLVSENIDAIMNLVNLKAKRWPDTFKEGWTTVDLHFWGKMTNAVYDKWKKAKNAGDWADDDNVIFEYNGSALVAMVGKNCFAIASDRHLGVQLQTIATDFQKIYKIHDKLFIGLAGLATDAQTLHQRLVFRHKLYHLREERDMKPETFASLVSALLYEKRAKVTAALLPYFDGDYWPGAAEDILYQLQQEEDGKKPHKKSTLKKSITKRALKASGQTDLSGNASKDLMLMHKLGETISPMKEDFIMVHLQYSCSHCCILIVTGTCWACKHCKSLQLCERCYDAEQKRDDRERHPVNHKDVHTLYSVSGTHGVPDDTKDNENLESEFFDTSQAFLSLCQGNHYQYDTLRRAKHSSMMVLYHLHNPTAPAFVTTCFACHLDIEAGHGWRCETCPDYEICNSCYDKGEANHPHILTNNQSSDHEAQNKEARQSRVTQLKKMLELLVHASQCRSQHCQYPNCRKVKGLFRHGMPCKIRASGGCPLCKKMWYLLQLHSRACKESVCTVPRCRDLKEHMRRLQQQSDSRRRAAVNEMMRQHAAEVAGSS